MMAFESRCWSSCLVLFTIESYGVCNFYLASFMLDSLCEIIIIIMFCAVVKEVSIRVTVMKGTWLPWRVPSPFTQIRLELCILPEHQFGCHSLYFSSRSWSAILPWQYWRPAMYFHGFSLRSLHVSCFIRLADVRHVRDYAVSEV
jgi:hypothetical protein